MLLQEYIKIILNEKREKYSADGDEVATKIEKIIQRVEFKNSNKIIDLGLKEIMLGKHDRSKDKTFFWFPPSYEIAKQLSPKTIEWVEENCDKIASYFGWSAKISGSVVHFYSNYSAEKTTTMPVFYHIAPIEFEQKILKQGLIPSAKKLRSYKNRVYVSSKPFKDNKNDLTLPNLRQYVQFKIDTSKLPNNIEFFHDDEEDEATGWFWTDERIPPRVLSVFNYVTNVNLI